MIFSRPVFGELIAFDARISDALPQSGMKVFAIDTFQALRDKISRRTVINLFLAEMAGFIDFFSSAETRFLPSERDGQHSDARPAEK